MRWKNLQKLKSSVNKESFERLEGWKPEFGDPLTTITNYLGSDGTLLVRFQPAIKINFVHKKLDSCSK